MNKIIIILLFISGCAIDEPTPFEAGEVVLTPIGCEALRLETPSADC